MTDLVKLIMVYGTLDAEEPCITRATLPAEEFPIAPHLTGIKAWTALSFNEKRLVVVSLESLHDKAVNRWKELRVGIKEDSYRFGLLLKARHVSH